MQDNLFFKRYELKYLITVQQRDAICKEIAPYMVKDRYFHSSIRNLYYDTQTFQLIRTSLDHPVYKEKIRLRSYARADSDTEVFVELKKKYDSIVYKRRIALPMTLAASCLAGNHAFPSGQIGKEIQAAVNRYGNLQPQVFLSYERDAYRALDGSGLRLTFDDSILFRQDALSLDSECYGTSLLSQGICLMELKLSENMPLWMAQMLSGMRIYRSTFSKYGAAYQLIQAANTKGDIQYV